MDREMWWGNTATCQIRLLITSAIFIDPCTRKTAVAGEGDIQSQTSVQQNTSHQHAISSLATFVYI